MTQPEGLKISMYILQRIAYSFDFDWISVPVAKKIKQYLASKIDVAKKTSQLTF